MEKKMDNLKKTSVRRSDDSSSLEGAALLEEEDVDAVNGGDYHRMVQQVRDSLTECLPVNRLEKGSLSNSGTIRARSTYNARK